MTSDPDSNADADADADANADIDPDLAMDEGNGVGVQIAEDGAEGELATSWIGRGRGRARGRLERRPVSGVHGRRDQCYAWNESENAKFYTLIQQFGKHSWGTIYKYEFSTVLGKAY